MSTIVTPDVWSSVRQFTKARIALGRSGVSLPTREVLNFSLAHAQARDAVHLPLDIGGLQTELAAQGYAVHTVSSAAPDRATYLRRPDWGRKLSDTSRATLALSRPHRAPEYVFVIADGLSSLAAEHALPLLAELEKLLPELKQSPIVIATQARVALGDEIGHHLRAKQLIMMIGERPGLSSPNRPLPDPCSQAGPVGCQSQLHLECTVRGTELHRGRSQARLADGRRTQAGQEWG